MDYYKIVESLVGKLKIVCTDVALVGIFWENQDIRAASLKKDHPLILAVEIELGEYFACKRQAFDIPIELRGTPFQLRVWTALREIPFGTTVSYSQIAEGIETPKAVRAVGTAIGKNPISIIIPCHRVIGSDGALRGFAGGLKVKAHLLEIERGIA